MIGKRIVLVIGALIMGVLGIVPLFAIGEGTGNGLAAFAADTVLFALISYGMACVDPDGRWVYGLILCAPVFLISSGSAGGEGALSLLMTVLTVGAAYLAPGGVLPRRGGP